MRLKEEIISQKITHGEAVLCGMILATKLSIVSKICSKKVLAELKEIYKENNLFTLFKILKSIKNKNLIPLKR